MAGFANFIMARVPLVLVLFQGAASPVTVNAQTVPPLFKAIPFEDIPFAPLNLAKPSAMQAHVLWGDPATGPSAMYLKFGRTSLPLHLHSADYHLLVVQGTMKHWLRGEAEADARPLGPGSYWFQAGGQVHADACLSDSCLVFLVWSGPRDGRMAPPDPPR